MLAIKRHINALVLSIALLGTLVLGGILYVAAEGTCTAAAGCTTPWISLGTTFPANPSTYALAIITDDTVTGACDSGGGASVSFCYYDGAAWAPLGGGLSAEADTLDTVFDRGKLIDGANSEANCVRIGTATNYHCLYSEAGTGLYMKPEPLASTYWRCWTNFNCIIRDEEGGADILTIDPDAASTLAMWQIGTAYRWKKSVWFGAGSLTVDGTQCTDPAVRTPVASGPKVWSVICADNAGSTMEGSIKMPANWDAGTVTFTHVYQQTAADTGVLNGDVACQARSNGESPLDWATGLSEIAIDDAAVVGSGANDMTTSAAVTCAGTGVAAGDMLYWRYQLDTATTTAVATLHHLGFFMTYSEVGPSQ